MRGERADFPSAQWKSSFPERPGFPAPAHTVVDLPQGGSAGKRLIHVNYATVPYASI